MHLPAANHVVSFAGMRCPSCESEMEPHRLDAVQGRNVEIDVCSACRAFWFDSFETLRLSAASTLQLFRLIADAARGGTAPPRTAMQCPRCHAPLRRSRDRQRNTPFQYDSCPEGHGRFERFDDFLKEKNFVQPLTKQQLDELRRNVRMIHCSNCAAAIDLLKESECGHCGSPLVVLDREAMSRVANDYHRAAEKEKAIASIPPPRFDPSSGSLMDFDLRSIAKWLMDVLAGPR